MKAFRIILRVISITLLASTLICGLYLAGKGTAVDPSSLQFHMTIGITGSVTGVAAMLLPSRKFTRA